MIKQTGLLVALVVAGLTFGTALTAKAGLRIELGDRPYYSHGPRYWEGEYEMIWIPGHWSDHGHHWIHGHYRRGEHRHHHHNDRINAEIHLNDHR
jgi:hypothetical protein